MVKAIGEDLTPFLPPLPSLMFRFVPFFPPVSGNTSIPIGKRATLDLSV
jgi:hypothetical protein